MTSFQQFYNKFKFNPVLAGHVGVEREGFLRDVRTGMYVPRVGDIVTYLADQGDDDTYGPEFSACQVESRTRPVRIEDLFQVLHTDEVRLSQAANLFGVRVEYSELGPSDMPFDYHPDPEGRYEGIANAIKREQYEAACRVAGLHVHVGMPDHDTALLVYNRVRKKVSGLSALADRSGGERLRLYKLMGDRWSPPPLGSWDEFYQVAVEEQFQDDPRSCYWLVRISEHGTIEFRMFGSIPSIEEIVTIASRCREECMSVISSSLTAA